eukprot:4587041-Alexandrium_andersonii.AAC.1
MQTAIQPRHAGAAIRPNPQVALRRMQNGFKRSELELRGPRNGLTIGLRSSRKVHSAPFSAQIPN